MVKMWSNKDLLDNIKTIIKTESVFDLRFKQALTNQPAAAHVTEDVNRFIVAAIGNVELVVVNLINPTLEQCQQSYEELDKDL